MKVLILGHGRHGKDTVAEILEHTHGLTFQSSSRAACEIFIYDVLRKRWPGAYQDIEDCYDDRHNHRELWKELITEYNPPHDKAKLCKAILAKNDCYVGMRCPLEYAASKDLFDVVIWVDALKRHPKDPTMLIERDESMIVIDNNSHLLNLKLNVLDRIPHDENSDLSRTDYRSGTTRPIDDYT